MAGAGPLLGELLAAREMVVRRREIPGLAQDAGQQRLGLGRPPDRALPIRHADRAFECDAGLAQVALRDLGASAVVRRILISYAGLASVPSGRRLRCAARLTHKAAASGCPMSTSILAQFSIAIRPASGL